MAKKLPSMQRVNLLSFSSKWRLYENCLAYLTTEITMVSKELMKSHDTGYTIMKLAGFQNVFSYSNFVHAFAGAVGSAVSMVIFFPLDTARTRLQIDDKRQAKHSPIVIAEIVKEEGFRSLYRGLFPVVATLCCSNFIYFYTYNCLKAVTLRDVKSDPVKDLIFATIAGIVNVLVTTPLWVVNTRLKLQGIKFETDKYKDSKQPRYRGIIDALLKIARFEGIASLWNGTKPSLILASNPAIQFMVYEMLKRYFQRTFHLEELSGFLYFVIGAIAKTVATIVTYPLQIIQSRSRAGHSGSERARTMTQAIGEIVRNQGLWGLYKGMESKLLQTVLTAAFMFMVYEKIAAAIFRLMGAEFLSPAKVK